MASRFRKIGISTLGIASGAALAAWAVNTHESPIKVVENASIATPRVKRKLPMRPEQIQVLQSGEEYDVLVIGGGATGAGVALDSITRGLKTALVEADDFASGTSSRSTKLIHGGVRYLQKAILGADIEQYRMVKEALAERANMLNSAPHLTHPLPIMLPVYQWWQVPYYWVGIKCYDLVAGDANVKSSYYLSKRDALELFPMLKGDKLCGAIVYYDGQQDDARMNLAIALTAARQGATICNHVEVLKLLKKPDSKGVEKLCGATVKDTITGKVWDVKAKCVINATGPFTDTIRKMDDPTVKTICCPSSGVHIVLPGYYSPKQMGLLDPSTSDGRVIFFLPWQNQTIAGTTDLACQLTHNPVPTEDEIQFILTEIKNYLNTDVEVRRGDVMSAWSGIRPLVSDPNKADTQSLARNHIVHVSPSNLITIAGGKWTTYRAMAEHTMDAAIKACNLKPVKMESQTASMQLEGANGWTPTMYIRLVQDFGLDMEVAQHLAASYGDRAFPVAKMAALTGKRWPIIGRKIHPEFPYIDAEIRYGCREYAMNAIDMIARRLRLAFLNVQAAQEALPIIVDIMAEELGWSKDEKAKQIQLATDFLAREMGQQVNRASRDKIPINLSKEEIQLYIKRFQIIDKDNKGYVSINDIRRGLKALDGLTLSDPEIHDLLNEIDLSYNGRMELSDFLQALDGINLSDPAILDLLNEIDLSYNGRMKMSDFLQSFGEADISGEELHEILREIDTNMNGQVELDEYLQMMSAIKSGNVAYSRFARMAELEEEKHETEKLKKKITVDRSGGGL